MTSILLAALIAAQCVTGVLSQYSPAATAPAVCAIDGQWQRTDAGEIEAWYTPEQLRLCLVAMNVARCSLLTDDAAGVGVEER